MQAELRTQRPQMHRLVPALLLVLLLLATGRAAAQTTLAHGPAGPSLHVAGPPSVAYGKGGPRYGRPVWVPGAYVEEHRRTFVPGRVERIYDPPLWEWRTDPCGRHYQVLVRVGTWRTVQHPGHWRTDLVRVWRPGHWAHGHYR